MSEWSQKWERMELGVASGVRVQSLPKEQQEVGREV